jgi:hypothetical protein
MKTLRDARLKGKIDEFIAEREDQPPADAEAFHATLNSMAGQSKRAPETSDQDECDD